jgi:hypothetical protein
MDNHYEARMSLCLVSFQLLKSCLKPCLVLNKKKIFNIFYSSVCWFVSVQYLIYNILDYKLWMNKGGNMLTEKLVKFPHAKM